MFKSFINRTFLLLKKGLDKTFIRYDYILLYIELQIVIGQLSGSGIRVSRLPYSFDK